MREISLRTMNTTKSPKLEGMTDDNHERGSVAETLDPSEENITTLTSIVRTTRETASDF